MDSINLTGMEFFGYHGALPEENRLGQRFIVDLMMELDLREAGAKDSLEDTVNYAEVYAVIRGIVEGQPFKTLEALAENIAVTLRREYGKIVKLTVTVHKPGAPIAGIFRDVSVTIRR